MNLSVPLGRQDKGYYLTPNCPFIILWNRSSLGPSPSTNSTSWRKVSPRCKIDWQMNHFPWKERESHFFLQPMVTMAAKNSCGVKPLTVPSPLIYPPIGWPLTGFFEILMFFLVSTSSHSWSFRTWSINVFALARASENLCWGWATAWSRLPSEDSSLYEGAFGVGLFAYSKDWRSF